MGGFNPETADEHGCNSVFFILGWHDGICIEKTVDCGKNNLLVVEVFLDFWHIFLENIVIDSQFFGHHLGCIQNVGANLHSFKISGISEVGDEHSHCHGSFLRVLVEVGCTHIEQQVIVELYLVEAYVFADFGVLGQLVQNAVDMAFVGGGFDVGKVFVYLLVVDTVVAGRKSQRNKQQKAI